MKTFGEQLIAARKAKGYTQDMLAALINVSRQTVSHWENGRALPDVALLRQLSDVLECNLALGYAPQETAKSPENEPATPGEECEKNAVEATPAAVESTSAPVPPAPKKQKPHWLWIAGVALAVLAVVICLAMLWPKPAAVIRVSPLEPVAYLQNDPEHFGEENSRGWNITFSFANESDVPFTPDYVLMLLYEGDRIDNKVRMSYDEIRPWMDSAKLRKEEAPLQLIFSTNHLYETRMECAIYGRDDNGHELMFRNDVQLSKDEQATQTNVKQTENASVTEPKTLAEFKRLHESQTRVAGRAYLNVTPETNPVLPTKDPGGGERDVWFFTIFVEETGGVAFKPETITETDITLSGGNVVFEYTPQQLAWADTIEPKQTVMWTGGRPVQELAGVGISVSGEDANGNQATFYGYVEFQGK